MHGYTLFTVVRHHPEDFLVTFHHQHHRELALSKPSFRKGILEIRIKPWTMEGLAEHVDMKFHVHLELEGVKLHAWDADTVTRAIGDECELDYIMARTVSREDTRTMGVWAWTDNPDNIPKVKNIKLPARVAAAAPLTIGRRALRSRVIVHLVMYEDFTGVEAVPGVPAMPRRTEVFDWDIGVVDGERRPHGNPVTQRGPSWEPRRDDDEDRDDGGRGRGRDGDRRSLRDRTMGRSRSRATRDRASDAANDGRGHDRHDSRRDGQRHRRGLASGSSPSPPPNPGGGPAHRRHQLDRPRSISPSSVLPTPSDAHARTESGPPGFAVSPMPTTPLLQIEEATARTPSAVPATPASPDASSTHGSKAHSTQPLFLSKMRALLSTPPSSPPKAPTARRKTIVGCSYRRSSVRLNLMGRRVPVARLAEELVCRRMGIVQDGEPVTEQAVAEFVRLFQGQLPCTILAALRALFRLDCAGANALEDALLNHGGGGAVDLANAAEDEAAIEA